MGILVFSHEHKTKIPINEMAEGTIVTDLKGREVRVHFSNTIWELKSVVLQCIIEKLFYHRNGEPLG